MDNHLQTAPRTHRGSCHCGALTFEVALDISGGVSRCNCTICTKVNASGMLIKPAAFKLLCEEGSLGTYSFGPFATRFFCKTCGIHAYGRGNIPELGGAFVSVNCNCLDDVDLGQIRIKYWDGRHDNWQAGTRETPWPIVSAAA